MHLRRSFKALFPDFVMLKFYKDQYESVFHSEIHEALLSAPVAIHGTRFGGGVRGNPHLIYPGSGSAEDLLNPSFEFKV